MASPALNAQDTCTECGSPLSAAMRHCPTCRADAGAPNVRACRTDENLKALAKRYDDARERTQARGCSTEFGALEALIKGKSGVVVSMSARVAMDFVCDPNFLYVNYEKLVGSGIRKPASPDSDRHRSAVGGVLFGACANEIRYGALSLNEEGLPTYGDVHCRLRPVAIDKRTSFLETNSCNFIQDNRFVPGDKLPVGYTACWSHRHSLVLAKLADRLLTGQTESDWQAILIHSDGQNRANDDFVEAHIYEGFDINAVGSMVASPGKKLSREEKLYLKMAISKFNRLRRKPK